jgi:hypothetical protein
MDIHPIQSNYFTEFDERAKKAGMEEFDSAPRIHCFKCLTREIRNKRELRIHIVNA